MKKRFAVTLLAIAFSCTALNSLALAGSKDPIVGGTVMSPSRNIVQNAGESSDHTTLVEAIKAGGLAQTLSGPGPYTIFAPTNQAFSQLPDNQAASLLKPENKQTLIKVLAYHVVPGRFSLRSLKKMIRQGKGKTTIRTIQGEELTAALEDGKVVLTDSRGGKATVTIADAYQSNGIIHVVNAVLMPN